jgi:hypothetical protein
MLRSTNLKPTLKARGTLRDVARLVGVSHTTVSNAFSRPNQLSPELREKILAAARSVQYPGPNPIWMPLNAMLIRALLQFYLYYGDNFKVECSNGSGRLMNLFEVTQEISTRNCRRTSRCSTPPAGSPPGDLPRERERHRDARHRNGRAL